MLCHTSKNTLRFAILSQKITRTTFTKNTPNLTTSDAKQQLCSKLSTVYAKTVHLNSDDNHMFAKKTALSARDPDVFSMYFVAKNIFRTTNSNHFSKFYKDQNLNHGQFRMYRNFFCTHSTS